jgi:hypothetical protein
MNERTHGEREGERKGELLLIIEPISAKRWREFYARNEFDAEIAADADKSAETSGSLKQIEAEWRMQKPHRLLQQRDCGRSGERTKLSP